MLVVAIGDTTFAAMLKPIMDRGFVGRDESFVRWVPVILILLAFTRAIGEFVDNYCMNWVARRVIQNLRQSMFERLIHAPAQYYDQHSSGTMVSRLIFDVEQVAKASSTAFRVLFRDAFKAIFLLLWMFYLSWKLSLIFILILPFAFLIFAMTSNRFRVISSRIQESVGDITHIANEALQGHRVVKIFGAYDHENRVFQRANNRNRQQAMKRATVLSASVPMIVLLVGVGVAAVIWLALQQEITPGVFSSYLVSMAMLMKPVKNLSKVNEVIQTGLAGAQSIFRTMDLQQEPGTTVALVGASGSGKSTIVSMLLRFYSPSRGQISLDGKALESVTLESLRANTAIVTQEVTLFDDTIRNNIAYGEKGEVDQEKLIAAATAANVMEFADSMTDGLDTAVGEQGARLSGGQRQRIAIARALYKDAPLLILDEATSSLDSHSEQHIQAAIGCLIENRTTLVIAHRLSTIESADLILVLENGRIVERGRHQELLANKGVYSLLHMAQHSHQDAQQPA